MLTTSYSKLFIVGLLWVGLNPPERTSSLFDNVVSVLGDRYYDQAFREKVLPDLVSKFRPKATAAKSLDEQRRVTHEFLSNIPASHLAILSKATYQRWLNELMNRPAPTLGFELIEIDGHQFIHGLLEGGPGAKAGLLRGDEVLSIDDVAVTASDRLDWRSDDAYVPDPPIRAVLCSDGDIVRLRIARRPGQTQVLEVHARPYSSYEAARAGARVIERDGKRIGYLHLWFIHLLGVPELLREHLTGAFADCDAFVLDLRGRGGSGGAVQNLLDLFDGPGAVWRRPVVGLINRLSRSAKDVIAYEFRNRGIGRLVGETTAGAVVPASFEPVGFDTVLMFPSFSLDEYTPRLEGSGVKPDVPVREGGPYSAGRDPVLEAGLDEAVRLAARQKSVADVQEPASPAAPSPPDGNAVRIPPDTAELPSTDQLLHRMVDALGGPEVIRKHAARTITATVDIAGMIKGKLIVKAAAPNLLLAVQKLGGAGTHKQGFDGSVGWVDSPSQGRAVLKGRELEQLRIEADFYAPLNYQRAYQSIDVSGHTRFANKDCLEVKLVDHAGSESTLYIDPRSYLIAGSKSVMGTPLGDQTVTTVYQDYKAFDGFLLPVTWTQDVGGFQKSSYSVHNVSFAPHEEGTFAIPDRVAELMQTGE